MTTKVTFTASVYFPDGGLFGPDSPECRDYVIDALRYGSKHQDFNITLDAVTSVEEIEDDE